MLTDPLWAKPESSPNLYLYLPRLLLCKYVLGYTDTEYTPFISSPACLCARPSIRLGTVLYCSTACEGDEYTKQIRRILTLVTVPPGHWPSGPPSSQNHPDSIGDHWTSIRDISHIIRCPSLSQHAFSLAAPSDVSPSGPQVQTRSAVKLSTMGALGPSRSGCKCRCSLGSSEIYNPLYFAVCICMYLSVFLLNTNRRNKKKKTWLS